VDWTSPAAAVGAAGAGGGGGEAGGGERLWPWLWCGDDGGLVRAPRMLGARSAIVRVSTSAAFLVLAAIVDVAIARAASVFALGFGLLAQLLSW